MNQAAPPNEDDLENLRMLYQASVAEIAAFKQQQWSVSNYALTLQAAFVIVWHQVFKASQGCAQQTVLIVLAWLVVVAAVATNVTLWCAIEKRRARMKRCREHFGDVFKEVRGEGGGADGVHWLLLGVLVASGAVSTWLLLTPRD